jgi:hypothetical protein
MICVLLFTCFHAGLGNIFDAWASLFHTYTPWFDPHQHKHTYIHTGLGNIFRRMGVAISHSNAWTGPTIAHAYIHTYIHTYIQGWATLFDAWAALFEENTTLERLDLTHNSIDERGALIIAENIRQNESILWLNLSENPLGRLGAKLMFKLVDVLGESRTLVFDGCNLDAKSKYCNFDAATPQVCVHIHTHVHTYIHTYMRFWVGCVQFWR